jgi:photosystem II oxygen-evolving enhancer protein 1
MFRFLVVLAVLAAASGLRVQMQMKNGISLNKIVSGAMAGVFAASTIASPALALTREQTLSLSYGQVKGSGLANRCPEVGGEGAGTIALANGKKYKVVDLCIEPKEWQVEEIIDNKGTIKKEYQKTKLMTRQTYSLDGVSGTMEIKDGKAVFTEQDGIDYAATTVQTPGGERVPFLFSVKNLIAKGSTAGPIKEGFDFGGSFTVPSYRTGLFLDPKGRGTTTGYDFSVALAAKQTGGTEQSSLFKEENKRFDVLQGDIEFAVVKVDKEAGEFGGVFVANQPSDTDMGAKTPKNILSKGIFFARFEEE